MLQPTCFGKSTFCCSAGLLQVRSKGVRPAPQLARGVKHVSTASMAGKRLRKTALAAKSSGTGREVSVGVEPGVNLSGSPPNAAPINLLMGVVLLLQSFALAGATVGGFLARKRRLALEEMNTKLRKVNVELRKRREQDTHVCEADANNEAMRSYRAALETALDQPSASHPIEEYGREGFSLAQARREFSHALQDAKGALLNDNGSAAMSDAVRALDLAGEIKDKRAERSALKVQAQAYRVLKDSKNALRCFEGTLEISRELDEQFGNVDTFGEMADTYADMGNFEKAGEYYDKCIEAIQIGEVDPISPFWDC